MAAVGRMATSLVTKTTGLARSSVGYATPRLQTFWKYARVELRPPKMSEMPQVQQGFQNIIKGATTAKWKQVSVKEAWLNTLVFVEICCWFTVGEIVGKRALIGYQVPGGVNFDVHF